MTQGKHLPALALNRYFYPAGQVLAEIIDLLSLGCYKLFYHLQAHNAAHRLVFLGN